MEDKLLPFDEMKKMLMELLAGKDVKAVTDKEKHTKAGLLEDIAYAKKMGYQIQIPYE